MDIMSNETTKSNFFEHLDQFFQSRAQQFDIKRKVTPLADQTDLTVDYEIPAKRPIFVFGVNGDSKASQVVITCLTFETRKVLFHSLVIVENIDNLNRFNRNRIVNESGKVFAGIEALRSKGPNYIARELAWLN